MPTYRCEVCGCLASVISAHEVVYDRPTRDVDGRWWSTCHVEGPFHPRCDDHPHHVANRESEAFKQWREEQDRERERSTE